MRSLGALKTALLIPVILAIAAAATPVSANWFSDPVTGMRKNVGSAPNPTPADIREYRMLKYKGTGSPTITIPGSTGSGTPNGSGSDSAESK